MSAEEKIRESFLALLKEKPLSKITVSALTVRSGINRTTFYRNYESVVQLFNMVCLRLTRDVLRVRSSDIRTADDLIAYGNEAYRRTIRNLDRFRLLGGSHGDMRFLWNFSNVFNTRMRHIAEHIGVTDRSIWRGIDASSGFLSLRLCGAIYGDRFKDVPLPEDIMRYQTDRSLFENIALTLQQARGGSFSVQYDLVMAEVKLFRGLGIHRSTVTELLETAGMNRTEFYQYYRNFDNWAETYIAALAANCVRVVTRACISDIEAAIGFVENVYGLAYRFVQDAAWATYENREMMLYLSTLIHKTAQTLERDYLEGADAERHERLEYYVGAYIMNFSMFCFGLLDKDTLRAELGALLPMRRRIGLPTLDQTGRAHADTKNDE